MVQFIEFNGDTSSCTLGPNVVDAVTGVRGFLVNSHCTRRMWGPDGSATPMYQNVVASTNLIGREARDKWYLTSTGNSYCRSHQAGALTATWECRWSDAAFFEYDAATTSAFAISRPFSGIYTDQNGSPSTVDGRVEAPTGNESLRFVGMRSGESSGNVTGTCLDVVIGERNPETNLDRVILCQERFNAPSLQSGDSGAPVFAPSTVGNGVTLYGMVWGGVGLEVYFSSLWAIQKDLGGLNVF
jgi:hypothetical protein